MSDRPRIAQPLRMEDGGLDPIKVRLDALESESDLSSISITCYNGSGSQIDKGSVCRVSNDHSSTPQIVKAQANSEANSKGMLLIASANIQNNDTGICYIIGKLSGFSGLTPGAIEYLSDDTAGSIEETATTDSGEIVRIIGYALSSTKLFFNPDITYIELL